MENAIVYPMAAMFLLTLFVLLRLFKVRLGSVRSGAVSPRYFLTYNTGEEESASAQKLSRHFSNLFEAPLLFYIVCLLVIVTDTENEAFIYLAWTYVVFRVVHAYIHTGKNSLTPRIVAYFASWFALIGMWAYLLITLGQLE